MTADTILKVRDIWINCNVDIQTALIEKFLDRLNRGLSEEWIDYLIIEFDVKNDNACLRI